MVLNSNAATFLLNLKKQYQMNFGRVGYLHLNYIIEIYLIQMLKYWPTFFNFQSFHIHTIINVEPNVRWGVSQTNI